MLHSRISISSDQLLGSLYLFTVMSLVHVFSSNSSFLCFFAIPPLAGQFLAQFFHFSLLQFTSSTSCLYLAICFATQSMSFFPPTLSTHLWALSIIPCTNATFSCFILCAITLNAISDSKICMLWTLSIYTSRHTLTLSKTDNIQVWWLQLGITKCLSHQAQYTASVMFCCFSRQKTWTNYSSTYWQCTKNTGHTSTYLSL